jgi:transposase
LVHEVSSSEFSKSEIPGYTFVEKTSNYGGITQRWLVVESEARLDNESFSSDEMLKKYKEQQNVERGFAFLKDPLFFADSIFLKSPRRIETMAMLMGLCLMVYSLGQREIRYQLDRAKTGIPNQVGKSTAIANITLDISIFSRHSFIGSSRY